LNALLKKNIKLNTTSEDNIKETIFQYSIYWKWFVLGIVICLSIAFVFLQYSQDIYQTSAKIQFLDSTQSEKDLFGDINSGVSDNTVNLENEIGVLKSQRLLRRVALALNLTTSYYFDGKIISSELWRNCPFKVIWLNTQDSIRLKKVKFSIEIEKDGYKIISQDKLNNQLFQFGQKNKVYEQSFILVLADDVVPKKSIKKQFTIIRTPLSVVTEDLLNCLKVVNKNNQGEVIALELNGENKEKSEAIINSIIDEFSIDGVLDRQLISQSTIDFVNNRFVYLSGELDSIENKKLVYKKDNNLSFLPEDAKETVSRKSITESEYFGLKNQIELAKLLEDVLKNDGIFELLPSNIHTVNENINVLIADFNKTIFERNKILKSAGPKNSAVLALSDKLIALKKNILYSVKVLQNQLLVSINNVKLVKLENTSLFSSIPAKEKILRSIDRQLNSKEKLYLFLLKKREEAIVSKAITSPSIKVVDYAITSFLPLAPKKDIIYVVTLFLGLLIPISIIFVVQILDTKIHNKQDFVRLVPSIPIVAEIPFIQEDHRIIQSNDRSLLAEAFRMLKSNCDYLIPIKSNGECPIIFTTSPIKGEGKTFVSINLALTLTSLDKKVVLIGADLRNPQLHKYQNSDKNQIGLSNYLSDTNTDWKSLINEKVFNNDFLNIIFAGPLTPNPAELLSNGRFEELLNILKYEYDYIIVDTAPTILVSDTFLISYLSDLTLYLINADNTERKMLTYSLDLKNQGKLKNMAYIINNIGSSNHFDFNYGYDYGYNIDNKITPKKFNWLPFLKNK
jgi:capsular exopolysaccharide synthesis family protein